MALSVLNAQQPPRSVLTLRRMLVDHVLPFADVIVILAPSGRRYHCHRAVLAAHSGHFRRMFIDDVGGVDMSTLAFSRIEVPLSEEIDVDGWEGVYDYIYGRVTEVDGRKAGLMAEVCRVLEFSELGKIVEKVIATEVGTRNAVELVMRGKGVRRKIAWGVLRKEFSKINNIVGLGKAEVTRLLKLNDLGVPDDEVVFRKVVQWVYGNYSLGQDVRAVESLIRLVRFPSLDEEALKRIEKSDFFLAYPSCKRFLMQGFAALSSARRSTVSTRDEDQREVSIESEILPGVDKVSLLRSSPLYRPRNSDSLTFVDHLSDFSKATTRIRTSARYFAGHLWCLWIDPQGTLNSSSSKYMSMFLCCLPEESSWGVDCTIDFSLFVIDQSQPDRVEPKEFRGAEFKKGGARIGFPRHTKLADIHSRDNGYLIGDVLVVGATIKLAKPERSKYVEFLELSHSDSDTDDSYD